MQSNTQTSKHGLKVHKWTEDHHNARVASATREPLGTKQINLLGEKLLQISALSLKGKNYSLGFRPGRALDLGNTGGNRANPSPTRPPDLCAPRDLTRRGASAAAGPRDHRPRTHSSERARREHNALQRTLDLMGKEDRGLPVLIFPSNPSASTATAPPQRQRGRCCEERRWKLPPQREFSPAVREEHTVCNVIYFRPHWPLICLLLVFLCLSF